MTRSDAKRLKRMRQIEEVHALADRFLAQARRASGRSPRSIDGGPTRKEIREADRVKRRERTANVRVEVFKRDGGTCVLCSDEATEMHHLVYGSGWRRIAESGQTCASLCSAHHKMAHAGARAIVASLLVWAARNRYTLAADALERRLDKIDRLAAQRAQGDEGERLERRIREKVAQDLARARGAAPSAADETNTNSSRDGE